jgi:hypothetical protein
VRYVRPASKLRLGPGFGELAQVQLRLASEVVRDLEALFGPPMGARSERHRVDRSAHPSAVDNLRQPGVHRWGRARDHTRVEQEPLSLVAAGHPTLLAPFLECLEGKPTPKADLVTAGRKLALGLVLRDRPIVVCGDGPWAGVWDLEKLTDSEAVSWGLCIATKVRHPNPRR